MSFVFTSYFPVRLIVQIWLNGQKKWVNSFGYIDLYSLMSYGLYIVFSSRVTSPNLA